MGVANISTSEFHLLLDPPGGGSWNMAVDEALLERAATEGQSTLRFYQWAEPTLSLGYFQGYSDREQHAASRGCAIVRRASGGGAIMHDFDVTYSLALPERHPLATNRLQTYRVVHEALVAVLANLGIEASLFACCDRAVARAGCGEPTAGATREPFLCFQRRASGDVLIGGEKIAGSAQRRCRGAVLQHGSVLLARSPSAPELMGLKELAGRPILVEEFIKAWIDNLSRAFRMTLRRSDLPTEQHLRATKLAAEKYGSAAWTCAR